MSDIARISPVQAARAVRLHAGRSVGSAAPEDSPLPQTVSQGELHSLAEGGRREQLEQAEPPSGSDSRSREKIDVRLQEALSIFNRSVNFRVDETTGRDVVTIRDRVTNEVIREIPSQEFLALVARLEEMRGLFFEEVV